MTTFNLIVKLFVSLLRNGNKHVVFTDGHQSGKCISVYDPSNTYTIDVRNVAFLKDYSDL